MVTTVAGPLLMQFAGNAQPQHVIRGPGQDAHQMFPGNDVTTWLVSSGVLDCAILTIVLDRPGAGVIRAMAHFNPFSGPRDQAITTLFNSCLAGATVNQLTVAISFHAGARGPYTDKLAAAVGQAVPALQFLTTHGYGVASPPGQTTIPITIYLSPTGGLSASQP